MLKHLLNPFATLCAAAASAAPTARRLIGRVFWLAAALTAAGCASLPSDVVRSASFTLPATTDTELGRIVADSTPDPALSGFRLLPSGPYALSTRLELLKRAQRSLDLQYYHLQNDEVGRAMLRGLRDASLRGVRVRLLVDDLFTSDIEGLLRALAAYPGVEVRLFNPFPSGRQGLVSRVLASLNDLGRVNARMHNKLFIADSVAAITGGRNLGSEYFMREGGDYFVDMDAFVVGEVVQHMSETFDTYWNSLYAYPVQALVPNEETDVELRSAFENALAGARIDKLELVSADPLGYGPLADDFEAGRLGLIWAPAELVADPPDKVSGGTRSYGGVALTDVVSVRYNVVEAIRRARHEVVLTSPYLVPGKRGLELIREARARGVKVTLITNSLATTDEPLVHIGYRRYRTPLLEAGVELYEFSPLRLRRVVRLGLAGLSRFRLHSKNAVIDREVVYVGSMNFDPRSEIHNTEMGLIIRSPELGRELIRLSRLLTLEGAYRVGLGPNGTLVWYALDEAGESTVATEPDSGFFSRILLELLAPLAIEELL